MKVRAHVFVNGMVQGVFFRSKTQYEAKKRNVTGWVRNLPDGRVEAVFEGEEEKVKELINFCKRGPPGARVTSVDVRWETYTGEFKDFEIKYGYRF
ncbi:MAG: acylphosphatase [Candidatus Bathyarchaeota archaeon]|nr:acylphosphatase [Candidatus Bathyarchaeota archaeon]MDI6805343.1 acylphosphatase [Candidatus Bathyarchaeia archaeon]